MEESWKIHFEWLIKIFKEEFDTPPGNSKKLCFQEAKIDAQARQWAVKFNNRNPPEKVIFFHLFT
jgi:hypothetical protein